MDTTTTGELLPDEYVGRFAKDYREDFSEERKAARRAGIPATKQQQLELPIRYIESLDMTGKPVDFCHLHFRDVGLVTGYRPCIDKQNQTANAWITHRYKNTEEGRFCNELSKVKILANYSLESDEWFNPETPDKVEKVTAPRMAVCWNGARDGSQFDQLQTIKQKFKEMKEQTKRSYLKSANTKACVSSLSNSSTDKKGEEECFCHLFEKLLSEFKMSSSMPSDSALMSSTTQASAGNTTTTPTTKMETVKTLAGEGATSPPPAAPTTVGGGGALPQPTFNDPFQSATTRSNLPSSSSSQVSNHSIMGTVDGLFGGGGQNGGGGQPQPQPTPSATPTPTPSPSPPSTNKQTTGNNPSQEELYKAFLQQSNLNETVKRGFMEQLQQKELQMQQLKKQMEDFQSRLSSMQSSPYQSAQPTFQQPQQPPPPPPSASSSSSVLPPPPAPVPSSASGNNADAAKLLADALTTYLKDHSGVVKSPSPQNTDQMISQLLQDASKDPQLAKMLLNRGNNGGDDEDGSDRRNNDPFRRQKHSSSSSKDERRRGDGSRDFLSQLARYQQQKNNNNNNPMNSSFTPASNGTLDGELDRQHTHNSKRVRKDMEEGDYKSDPNKLAAELRLALNKYENHHHHNETDDRQLQRMKTEASNGQNNNERGHENWEDYMKARDIQIDMNAPQQFWFELPAVPMNPYAQRKKDPVTGEATNERFIDIHVGTYALWNAANKHSGQGGWKYYMPPKAVSMSSDSSSSSSASSSSSSSSLFGNNGVTSVQSIRAF